MRISALSFHLFQFKGFSDQNWWDIRTLSYLCIFEFHSFTFGKAQSNRLNSPKKKGPDDRSEGLAQKSRKEAKNKKNLLDFR